MRAALAAIALLASPAAAQIVSPLAIPAPDTSNLATKGEVAAVAAQIPVPAGAVPPTEMVGGTVGSPGTYRPADAAQPRITRAGVVTTDVSGNWSITWTSALAATPIVLPLPINSTTQPVVCNVATRTTTSATGRCWLARTLPATLTLLTQLISYDLFGAAASGISVQVIALPPTQ